MKFICASGTNNFTGTFGIEVEWMSVICTRRYLFRVLHLKISQIYPEYRY